ncbi:MAG TPA: hypothetical protein VMU13_00230 [Candidatus Paceibacterota bacterium]|nr:hypothetical protein [Candidatus Paceibacterota bacterium]
MGSSVNAQGSSTSHVRRIDAAAYAAASFLALTVLLCNPLKAHAQDGPSQLVWGDVTQDYYTGEILTSDQIYLEDGGTYSLSIGVSKSAHVQIRDIEDGYTQNPIPAYGLLYFLPDPTHATERDFVVTIGGYSGTTTLAWNKPGIYELDTYKILGPVLNDRFPYWKSILHEFIGTTAYAQVDNPPYQTIRFTITDIQAQPKTSNILFIPGTESSRLYQNTGSGEQQVWEPAALSNQPGVQSLDLKSDGTSITPTYTKGNGAIDTVGYAPFGIPISVQNVYKTFLQQLAGLKASSTISDYLVFPYDWRMSPEDVVTKGTRYDDGVHHLDAALEALAATSQTGKVTIVAHSNGGLIAKALMNQLVQEGKSQLVDKIILVAVPQDGTPKTLAVLLHGDETGIPPFVVSQETTRALVENMPDAYDLLPSAAYFSKVVTPVVDLSAAPALRATAGFATSTITTASNLRTFLTGLGGRTQSKSSDVETPSVLSATLLTSADALHTDLDNWQPPAGVQVIQIAGWGVDTASGIVYSESVEPTCSFVLALCTVATTTRHAMNLTEDGDGTVVIPSAVATTSWETYYVDLDTNNHDHGLNLNHASILEAKPTQNLLNLLLSSSTELLPTYVTTTLPIPASNDKRMRLRVLSPVSLDAYDTLGNHTGVVPGQDPRSDILAIEENIPGSYYQRYGEGQYIGLPADGDYHVVLHGESTGTFTFQATPVSGGVAGTPVSFTDIPVTASSTALINVSASNPSSTTLALDVNGDGIIDTTIASSSQTTDPLAYTKLIKVGIAQMDIGNPVQRQLQAKFANVLFLLNRIDRWDDDDDDGRDTNRADKLNARIIKKLNKIETYIENEVGKPISRRIKDERITQLQAAAILGMIEELKVLLNTKQL